MFSSSIFLDEFFSLGISDLTTDTSDVPPCLPLLQVHKSIDFPAASRSAFSFQAVNHIKLSKSLKAKTLGMVKKIPWTVNPRWCLLYEEKMPKDTFLFPKASLQKHLLLILIPLANLVNTYGCLLHTEQHMCCSGDVICWLMYS